MTYDWQETLQVERGTEAFYREIDARFFESSRHFGHPTYPDQPPFSEQIDYAGLKGKRVLEIGCGMGATAAALARNGLDLSAVDITPTAIEQTTTRFKQLGLVADIRQADAEQLPFDDNTFDLVWSWGVIHHSANMQQIIHEIHRTLKPGGKTQIMVYNRHSIRNWVLAGLMEGVLKGQFFKKPYEEILRDVTDGYIARHLTPRQARNMFADFNNIHIEFTCLDDLSYVPGNTFVERNLVGKLIPRAMKDRWDHWVRTKFGWFLYLEATK